LKPLSSSLDRSIRSWKVEENAHLVFRGGHKAAIDTVKILNDEQFLSGSQDGKLCLWTYGKKSPIATVQAAHGLENDSTSSSSSSSSSSHGNSNSTTNRGTPRWITSLHTIKASDIAITGSYDGYIKLWSTQNNHLEAIQSIAMKGFVNGLYVSSRLIIAGCSREHRLGRWWNIKGAKDRLTIIRFKDDLETNAQQQAQTRKQQQSSQRRHNNNNNMSIDMDDEEQEEEEEDDDDDEEGGANQDKEEEDDDDDSDS
jgi:ribosomal RNA-processing protein 9